MNLSRPLTDGQRLDWLRLARTRNVGPVTFAQLILRYGDAGRALERAYAADPDYRALVERDPQSRAIRNLSKR